MKDAGLVGQQTVGQRLPPGDRLRPPVPRDELVWLGDQHVGRDRIRGAHSVPVPFPFVVRNVARAPAARTAADSVVMS